MCFSLIDLWFQTSVCMCGCGNLPVQNLVSVSKINTKNEPTAVLIIHDNKPASHCCNTSQSAWVTLSPVKYPLLCSMELTGPLTVTHDQTSVSVVSPPTKQSVDRRMDRHTNRERSGRSETIRASVCSRRRVIIVVCWTAL